MSLGPVPGQASIPCLIGVGVGLPHRGHALGSKASQVLDKPCKHVRILLPSDAEESFIPAIDFSSLVLLVFGVE